MNELRNIIVGIVSLAVAALAVVVFATLGLAVIGFAVVAAGIAMIMARLQGRARVRRTSSENDPHVWNDGRGTIIDM